MTRLLLLALLLTSPAGRTRRHPTPAATPAAKPMGPTNYSVRTGQLTYRVVHKLHEVVGTCGKPEGKARLLPDGTLQVMVTAPVTCFDSGNGNRDAHMLEAVEGQRFQTVLFKGAAAGFSAPTHFPDKRKVHLDGLLNFHGTERPQAVDLDVSFSSENEVTVDATFSVSLEAFRVQRPALVFVKVDDPLVLGVHLVLARDTT